MSRLKQLDGLKMLSSTDRSVAIAFKQRIQDVVPVVSLRIYGSRARGDADADSDLDVFIELENITPSLRRQISEIAWEVGLEIDRVISTLVATRAQIAHGAIGANPIMRHVAMDGVLL
ncbi:MAG: nucleotidyltransferase domain-containing protein [Caldilineaceae bacterium]|nr:nucleotidyltransferase domain-containing protein [Caldilineaceae bacterium]